MRLYIASWCDLFIVIHRLVLSGDAHFRRGACTLRIVYVARRRGRICAKCATSPLGRDNDARDRI